MQNVPASNIPVDLRRKEGWVDGRQQGANASALASMGHGFLFQNRRMRTFEGIIQDTATKKYGIHYHWGDYLSVEVETLRGEARLDAVTITNRSGVETIRGYANGAI